VILLTAAAVLLTLVVIAFVLYPIVRPSRTGGVPAPAPVDELRARRDRTYDELHELEFDFRVGKVSEEDYRESRRRLELEAARVLQALDRQVGGKSLALDAAIEAAVQRARESQDACPRCGAKVAPGARFCAACGAGLATAAHR
jgi:rRNA maturation endonuclease Nob1